MFGVLVPRSRRLRRDGRCGARPSGLLNWPWGLDTSVRRFAARSRGRVGVGGVEFFVDTESQLLYVEIESQVLGL